MKECKHKLKFHSRQYSGKSGKIWEKCSRCDEIIGREMTKVEHRLCMKEHRESERKSKERLKLWRKFQKLFLDRVRFNKFRYKGGDFIERVERFAKRNPTVKITWVDDGSFASSVIVFIPHETSDDYWGTTAIMIPQCTGEDAVEFFLYPGHVNALVEVLQDIQKQQKAKPSD